MFQWLNCKHWFRYRFLFIAFCLISFSLKCSNCIFLFPLSQIHHTDKNAIRHNQLYHQNNSRFYHDTRSCLYSKKKLKYSTMSKQETNTQGNHIHTHTTSNIFRITMNNNGNQNSTVKKLDLLFDYLFVFDLCILSVQNCWVKW